MNELIPSPQNDYRCFIAGKRRLEKPQGILATDDLTRRFPKLFDYQVDRVRWALRLGRAAIFAACGLGKTFMQLAWGQSVVEYTNRPLLILAPLAVSNQTARTGAELGAEVKVCRQQSDVCGTGMFITNYELLAKFDPEAFGAVILDESSILKNFTGRTKQCLVNAFARTPYRLCCTATPAPNDVIELGNHSEFLGLMPPSEMLMNFFLIDTQEAGNYRLKRHAAGAFWTWVASWASFFDSPADLGFSAVGFDLPPMVTHEHYLSLPDEDPEQSRLFSMAAVSAMSLHRETSRHLDSRVQAAAELVPADEPAVIWCHTNSEAQALAKGIAGAENLHGSLPIERKEELLNAFSEGQLRRLVTKASIAGLGLNWQHCRTSISVGVNYSFEARYQALRRLWRFGQKRTVHDHVILTPAESSAWLAQKRKEAGHKTMSEGARAYLTAAAKGYSLDAYNPGTRLTTPKFLETRHENL